MTGEPATSRFCKFMFRVGSSVHTIEDISSRLGMQPTKAFRKGELEWNRQPRDENVWVLRSAADDTVDLPEHMDLMLGLLEPAADGLGTLLDEDAWCELRATFASTSGQFRTALSAAQIARLARLQVDLLLDLYPPQS